MSPDDIFEQSDSADATLNLAYDPVGSLMVTMRIVSPADKERSSSDFPRAISDGFDRALGLFALMRDKAIWEPEETHILWLQPELRARLFRLVLAESAQPVRRIGFAVGMRAGAVADNDDLCAQSLSASGSDQSPAGQALVVEMRRDHDKRPIFEHLTQRAERKRMGRVQSFADP